MQHQDRHSNSDITARHRHPGAIEAFTAAITAGAEVLYRLGGDRSRSARRPHDI